MRIALLGNSSELANVAAAGVRAGHTQVLPGFSWEELLHGTQADVVLVAARDMSDLRADQLRKLTQAGVGLLTLQPACEAIVGFEIDMIRRDTKAAIVPYLPACWHPAVARLAAELRHKEESPWGQLDQLAIERCVTDRGREAVLAELACDAALIRTLLGSITRVNAMGPTADAESYANLSVHMQAGGTLARWSVGPALGQSSARLSLVGAHGQATLLMPSSGPWTLETSGRESRTETFEAFDAAAEAWTRFSACRDSALEPSPTWHEACRGVEVAETARRSLLRGKTFDLYQEEHTEKATFMSLMAAGGCLLLFATLGMILVAVLVAAVRLPLRQHPVRRYWPVVPFALLATFMLAQLLILVFKSEKRHGKVEEKSKAGEK